MDEGIIKFKADWQRQAAFDTNLLEDLIHYRQLLYQHGLVGVYPNGIGYGNISRRIDQNGQFFISGSGTGHLAVLQSEHFSKVVEVRADENLLVCVGPIIASSESMSHAAFYELSPNIGAVLHVHHEDLWHRLLRRVPTTPASVPYGTPAMHHAIQDLWRERRLEEQRVVVMEGHEEGIFTFGTDLKAAYGVLMALFSE